MNDITVSDAIEAPNRQGRKLMQSYFRKKGVAVGFV